VLLRFSADIMLVLTSHFYSFIGNLRYITLVLKISNTLFRYLKPLRNVILYLVSIYILLHN